MPSATRRSSVKENQSVRNACTLLAAIAQDQPIGVSELARRTGVDKSAAHRIAVTLRNAGWLTATDQGRWRISPGLASVIHRASTGSLVDAVRPTLELVRDKTTETTMLVTIEHGHLLVLDAADSPHPLRITAPAGSALPIRNSSALRAIAAQTPPEGLDALRQLDPGLDDRTITETRNRGWAINDREITADTRVAGAAIRRPDGRPLAIIVCAPATRVDLDTLHGIGALLADTTRQLALD